MPTTTPPQQNEATSSVPAKRETPSVLTLMAAEYNLLPTALAETLKKTIFPSGDATNEQLAAFVAVAHHYQLNPFLKEIYAFPTKNGGVMPVVSVDGWLKMVNRDPNLEWFEIEVEDDDKGQPYAAKCTIKRKDRERPLVLKEYYSECKRNTDPWNGMPHRMLRHKALSQCARYAFGFGGIYDEDEARDAAQGFVGPVPNAGQVIALPSAPETTAAAEAPAAASPAAEGPAY